MRTVMMALTAMSVVALPLEAGHAQVRCPEGRTASGQCVDPGLAAINTLRVIAFTQPKFSYTAPPFLPNADRTYRAPVNFHEANSLLNFPPSTNPGFFAFFVSDPDLHLAPFFIPTGPRP
jgi:hypothetical protein